MIVLAVALVFNLPAMLQRAVPDYTAAMQKGIGANDIRHKLNPGGAGGGSSRGQLADCADGGDQLQQCGPAPAVTGITQWLNTPGGEPIDLASLRGKVVLIDFWAYSCINCQRAIGHVVDWYNRYHDDGFVVIGVHTPEYAFERVPGNVASGAAALHITYPVALDNDYTTWNNYQNLYWPAEYLIDANGTVRHTKFGEGDYDTGRKADPPTARRCESECHGCPERRTRSTRPRTPGSPPRPTWVSARPKTTAATANTRRALPRSATPRHCRRQVRPARPLDPGRPGRHRRQRRCRHPAELHRQGCLRRRRRHRHHHGDPGGKTTTTADRRGSHAASDRCRRDTAHRGSA